jgi:hypothetical protein
VTSRHLGDGGLVAVIDVNVLEVAATKVGDHEILLVE